MDQNIIQKAKSKVLSVAQGILGSKPGQVVSKFGGDLNKTLQNIGMGTGSALQTFVSQPLAGIKVKNMMTSQNLASQAMQEKIRQQQGLPSQQNIPYLLSQSRAYSNTPDFTSSNLKFAESNLQKRIDTGTQQTGIAPFLKYAAPAANVGLTGKGLKTISAMPILQKVGTLGVSAGISGIAGALSGQNPLESAVAGVLQTPRIVGLTGISSPATKYGAAGIMDKISSPLARNIMGRGLTGLGNVVEDEILSRLDSIKPGVADRVLSFGIGAFLAPVKEYEDYLKSERPEVAQRIRQVVRDIQGRYAKKIGVSPESLNYFMTSSGRKVIKGEAPKMFGQDVEKINKFLEDNIPGAKQGFGNIAEPVGGNNAVMNADISKGLTPEVNPLKIEADRLLNKPSMTKSELSRYSKIGDAIKLEDDVDFFTKQVQRAKEIGNSEYISETQPILDRKIGELANIQKQLSGLTPEVTNTPTSPQSTKSPQLPSTVEPIRQVNPLDSIINPVERLRETYKQAGDKFQEAHYQVLSEMDVAYPGKRIKKGDEFGGYSSGFPQWVSPDFRDKKLFDKVMSNVLDPDNIVQPKIGTKEFGLQQEILNEIESRAGINASDIRSQIASPKTKIKVVNQNTPVRTDVYNAEPKPGTIKTRNIQQEKAIANQDYKEWQAQVLKDTVTPKQNLNSQIKGLTDTIKQNTTPGGVQASDLKDLSGFKSYTRDVYRNFKEVYGNKFGDIKRVLLDPFDQAKGNLTRSYEKWAGRVNNEVEKGLGIMRGSKESAAVQLFGEGKLKPSQLIEQFGRKKAENIVNADKWFRNEYDKLLGEVNAVMARIYPNNPEKIIPRRSDYYRHFKEMGNSITGLLNIFDSPSNISSSLAGTSEFVKPRSKWLSFAQKRLGKQTDIDAVGGFLDYVKSAEYNKNIDPFTNQFRRLAEDLAIQTEKDPKLNGFIEYLHDFSNDLAGKTNPADRFVQKIIPGGRKTMSVINWLNNRVKANTIVGNLSSSVAQIFNVPQGIADAGIGNSTKGLGLSVANIFGESTPIKKSNFITERYGGGAFDRFDRSMVDNVKKGAVWLTGVLDEVGTKYIWNSQYAKALAENISNPIKFADDQTRKLVAGRGIGEVPLIQKSKIFQLVAPFQLEVGNLWHVMGDWVGEKQFGKLATFFVASHLFNKVAEAVRGSDVALDPIQASIDAYNTYSQEEEKKMGLLKAGGRLGGEFLSNIPVAQNMAAAYPEYGLKVGDTQLPTRSEFFGEGDPTRFGSGLLLTKGLQDPLYKILPPFGGNQLKRTIEGQQATNRGFSESKTGRVRFPVENTPLRNTQRAVFGEYSTPAAREYFNSKASVLGEKQSQEFKNLMLQSPQSAIDFYNQIIEKRSNKNETPITKQEISKTETVKPVKIKTAKKASVKKPRKPKQIKLKSVKVPKVKQIKVKQIKIPKSKVIKLGKLKKPKTIKLKTIKYKK